jgi:MATE family multidrug resistance protein
VPVPPDRQIQTQQPGALGELLRLSLPMVISQGAFAVMVFFDRWFLSLIDPVHMASALGGGVASFFSISLFVGVLAYGNALVAQYFGAGSYDRCPEVVTQGLLLGLASLPLVAVVAWLVYDLFAAMGHDARQVELERRYYLVLMYGCYFNFARTCLGGYFAGIGRSEVVMTADVTGMAINIPLSYLLIFGKAGLPELGIAGAAWGTVLSMLVSLLVYAAFYTGSTQRRRFRVLRSLVLSPGILRRYLRLGIPSGFELFMNVATFNLFLLMFQSYGVTHGAAAAIVFNWDMVSFVPLIGLNIGVISLIGRYVGADDMGRADAVIRAAFRTALAYSGCLAVVFILFRAELVAVFAGPGIQFQEIAETAGFMMVGLACYVMADATILVSGGVLRGAGDTRWLMAVSISLHWLMLVAQYFIILVYDWGYRASWLAFVTMILAIAVTYVARLRGGVWREPARLAKVMQE